MWEHKQIFTEQCVLYYTSGNGWYGIICPYLYLNTKLVDFRNFYLYPYRYHCSVAGETRRGTISTAKVDGMMDEYGISKVFPTWQPSSWGPDHH